MNPVLRKCEGGKVAFYCHGCRCHHVVPVEGSGAWQFNGDMMRPTLSPSILVRSHTEGGAPGLNHICHLFVTDGSLHYLSDCTHEFASHCMGMKENSKRRASNDSDKVS